MSFSKSYGPVVIAESAGGFSVSIDDSVAAGGGSMAGVVSASGKASAEVNGALLADAGLAWLEAKFPAEAVIIAGFKSLVDAEIAKL